MRRAINPQVIPDRMLARDLSYREMSDMTKIPLTTFRRIALGLADADLGEAVRIAAKLRARPEDLFRPAVSNAAVSGDQRKLTA